MRFFRKIGKFAIISEKLGLKPNKLGRKHRKFIKSVTLHNTTKLVRNSHLLSQKSGISSSATTIAFQKA